MCFFFVLFISGNVAEKYVHASPKNCFIFSLFLSYVFSVFFSHPILLAHVMIICICVIDVPSADSWIHVVAVFSLLMPNFQNCLFSYERKPHKPNFPHYLSVLIQIIPKNVIETRLHTWKHSVFLIMIIFGFLCVRKCDNLSLFNVDI